MFAQRVFLRCTHTHRYTETWKQRAELITKDHKKQRTFELYPEYPTTSSEEVKNFCGKVMSQLTFFRNKRGIFARDYIMDAAASMPAYLWWDAHGGSCTELATVARLVLSQPGSSSVCERINSEFAFIKDRKRNRLTHTRADKLVSLFHNLRIMKGLRSPRYVEHAVAWLEEGEVKSGITKWGIANYE